MSDVELTVGADISAAERQLAKLQGSVRKAQRALATKTKLGVDTTEAQVALNRARDAVKGVAKAQREAERAAKSMAKEQAQGAREADAGFVKMGVSLGLVVYAARQLKDLAATGFGMARGAAQMQDATKVMEAAGIAMQSMREATKGMISDRRLSQQVNLARIMGINANQFSEMSRIAAAAARSTGQSMDLMLNSIVVGSARQSRLMLDNLGLVVDVKTAQQEYAKSIGTTVDKLDDWQKRQAFVELALKRGQDLIKEVDAAGANAGVAFDQLEASFENIRTTLGTGLVPAFEGLRDVLVEIDRLLKTAFGIEQRGKMLAALEDGPIGQMKGELAVLKSFATNRKEAESAARGAGFAAAGGKFDLARGKSASEWFSGPFGEARKAASRSSFGALPGVRDEKDIELAERWAKFNEGRAAFMDAYEHVAQKVDLTDPGAAARFETELEAAIKGVTVATLGEISEGLKKASEAGKGEGAGKGGRSGRRGPKDRFSTPMDLSGTRAELMALADAQRMISGAQGGREEVSAEEFDFMSQHKLDAMNRETELRRTVAENNIEWAKWERDSANEIWQAEQDFKVQKIEETARVVADFAAMGVNEAQAALDMLITGEENAVEKIIASVMRVTGGKLIGLGLVGATEGAIMLATGNPAGAAPLGLGIAAIGTGVAMGGASTAIGHHANGGAFGKALPSQSGVSARSSMRDRANPDAPQGSTTINISYGVTGPDPDATAWAVAQAYGRAQARGMT